MKITVIGAGSIGAAVAQDLTQRPEVTHVQLCDTRARILQDVHDRFRSPKLRSFQVDVRDLRLLASIIEGSSSVIACVPARHNLGIARLCLDKGVPYCDLGGNDAIVREIVEMSEAASAKQIWLVPNCGLTPGLVNVACLHAVEQFDEVDAACIRVGDVPLDPQPPFNFRIAWSADKVIEDYTNPAPCIVGGERMMSPPLSDVEEVVFGEPFERMEAFHTGGGLSMLVDALEGKVRLLSHKAIRWPGHAAQMQFLTGLGLADKQNIDVRTHLTYRDVLVRRLNRRLGGQHRDVVLLRVAVTGQQGGDTRTLVYEMIEHYRAPESSAGGTNGVASGDDVEAGRTAIEHCTSIPAAEVAYLLAARSIAGGGAATPEHVVDKARYLDAMTERGLALKSAWYAGEADVRNPGEFGTERIAA
jgi:saccharopine dehydrogenase-like NADP-dependent oxidoreductase